MKETLVCTDLFLNHAYDWFTRICHIPKFSCILDFLLGTIKSLSKTSLLTCKELTYKSAVSPSARCQIISWSLSIFVEIKKNSALKKAVTNCDLWCSDSASISCCIEWMQIRVSLHLCAAAVLPELQPAHSCGLQESVRAGRVMTSGPDAEPEHTSKTKDIFYIK